MNPLLLFLLAILSPMLLAITLLVPPYIGITAASYIIYLPPKGSHPLADRLDSPFYIIDVYSQLFSQWAHHMEETNLISYTLPLLILPILGIMLSIWLTGKLARKLKDIFQAGMSL